MPRDDQLQQNTTMFVEDSHKHNIGSKEPNTKIAYCKIIIYKFLKMGKLKYIVRNQIGSRTLGGASDYKEDRSISGSVVSLCVFISMLIGWCVNF